MSYLYITILTFEIKKVVKMQAIKEKISDIRGLRKSKSDTREEQHQVRLFVKFGFPRFSCPK